MSVAWGRGSGRLLEENRGKERERGGREEKGERGGREEEADRRRGIGEGRAEGTVKRRHLNSCLRLTLSKAHRILWYKHSLASTERSE